MSFYEKSSYFLYKTTYKESTMYHFYGQIQLLFWTELKRRHIFSKSQIPNTTLDLIKENYLHRILSNISETSRKLLCEVGFFNQVLCPVDGFPLLGH